MARSAFHRTEFYGRSEPLGANEARRYFRERFIEAIGKVTLDQVVDGGEWSSADLHVLKLEWESARATAIRKLRGRRK